MAYIENIPSRTSIASSDRILFDYVAGTGTNQTPAGITKDNFFAAPSSIGSTTPSTGAFTNLTASTSLTTPRINDANGNELILFTTTPSAVNEFTIINAATGSFPELRATGGDSNVGMIFRIQGNANYQLRGTSLTSAVLRMFENSSNGSNSINVTVPSAVSVDKTWTLPEGDVLNGVWVSNNAGVLTTGRMAFAEGFFDGTAGSPAFSISSNFGAITKNGTGYYTLAFANVASSTNYIVTGSVTNGVLGQENDVFGLHDAGARLTTSVSVRVRDANANAWVDNNGIYVRVERVVS